MSEQRNEQQSTVIQPYVVLMSVAHGRRAIFRGNLSEAERWFKLAERAAAISQRLRALEAQEERANDRLRVARNPWKP